MIGSSTPDARIEAASSARASGANVFRGWWGFGTRLSIGRSRIRLGSSASGGGSKAPSPRPSTRFITRQDLLGQFQVRDRPRRPQVVLHDSAAVARRLREADAPRDDGPKQVFPKVSLD